MELPTIEMNQAEARKRYQQYRKAIVEKYGSQKEARDADRALLRAYRELGNGVRVLDLVKALQLGGTVTVMDGDRRTILPALAICRADAKWCACTYFSTGSLLFQESDDEFHRPDTRVRKNKKDVRVGKATLPSWPPRSQNSYRTQYRGRAMVPEVPLPLHPKHGLGNYHILWEAEWEPIPPVDPVLLQHLGGDLYAVLAQWDLTPIEQAVLRGLRA
jgi:hypothetical protein